MNENEAEKIFKKAEENLKGGRWLRALSFYQKILQNSEINDLGLAEAFVRAGECFLNLQIYNEAEDYFRQAAALDPFNPEPHYYLGVIFTKTSRLAEAVAELQLAHQCQPQETAIWRALGWALFLTGHYRAGERLLKQCLTANRKDLYAACDLAVLYLNSAAFAKAEAVIAAAEKISPRHPLLLGVKTACTHFKSLKNNLERQNKPSDWRQDWMGEVTPSAPSHSTAAKAKTPHHRPSELPSAD